MSTLSYDFPEFAIGAVAARPPVLPPVTIRSCREPPDPAEFPCRDSRDHPDADTIAEACAAPQSASWRLPDPSLRYEGDADPAGVRILKAEGDAMAPELQPGHGLVHRMANARNIGTASINCLEALTDSSFLRMVSIRALVVLPLPPKARGSESLARGASFRTDPTPTMIQMDGGPCSCSWRRAKPDFRPVC